MEDIKAIEARYFCATCGKEADSGNEDACNFCGHRSWNAAYLEYDEEFDLAYARRKKLIERGFHLMGDSYYPMDTDYSTREEGMAFMIAILHMRLERIGA